MAESLEGSTARPIIGAVIPPKPGSFRLTVDEIIAEEVANSSRSEASDGNVSSLVDKKDRTCVHQEIAAHGEALFHKDTCI